MGQKSEKMVVTRRQAPQQPASEREEPVVTEPVKSNGRTGKKKKEVTPVWVYALLGVFFLVTVTTIPHPFHPQGEPTLQHVFYYGWLTALSTGLGVAPFLFIPDVPSFWVGISNGRSLDLMQNVPFCDHVGVADSPSLAAFL